MGFNPDREVQSSNIGIVKHFYLTVIKSIQTRYISLVVLIC